MRLFKITFVMFLATIIITTIKVAAENNWYFAGNTISGSSTIYQTDRHQKYNSTPQSFYLRSCKDKVIWLDRNLKVRITNADTSLTTSFKELSGGETVYFNENYVKTYANFIMSLKIANPLVSSVYYSGTWYID